MRRTLAWLSWIVGAGCSSGISDVDDCPTSVLGAPRASIVRSDTSAIVSLSWDPVANLPESYYDAVEPSLGDSELQIESPRFLARPIDTSSIGSLSVELLDVDARLGTGSDGHFAVAFGDARSPTGCQHPGMNDSYVVVLRVMRDATSALQIRATEQRIVGDL